MCVAETDLPWCDSSGPGGAHGNGRRAHRLILDYFPMKIAFLTRPCPRPRPVSFRVQTAPSYGASTGRSSGGHRSGGHRSSGHRGGSQQPLTPAEERRREYKCVSRANQEMGGGGRFVVVTMMGGLIRGVTVCVCVLRGSRGCARETALAPIKGAGACRSPVCSRPCPPPSPTLVFQAQVRPSEGSLGAVGRSDGLHRRNHGGIFFLCESLNPTSGVSPCGWA